MVETPPFMAVEFEFIWAVRNIVQIRTTHRAAPYVQSCVLKPMVNARILHPQRLLHALQIDWGGMWQFVIEMVKVREFVPDWVG